MLSAILPWPDKALSPNARSRTWHKGYKAKKAYRRTCWAALKEQGVKAAPAGRLSVALTFHPPAAYGYDQDNLIARMKAGLDALSDVLGVDDSLFELGAPVIAEPCRPHGKVIVTVEAI